MERICPIPRKWCEYWELIGSPPDLQPYILAGWYSTDRAKRERFRQQVDYAERTGRGEASGRFLADLTDNDWHTCPEGSLDFDYGAALAEDARRMEAQDRLAQEEITRARQLYAELRALTNDEAFHPENLGALVSELWQRYWLHVTDVGTEQRVNQLEEHLRSHSEWASFRDDFAKGKVEAYLGTFHTSMQIERLLLKLHLCWLAYNRLTGEGDSAFWQDVFVLGQQPD